MHTRLPKEQLEETHYWFYTVDQFVNTHAIPMLAYSKRRKAQATNSEALVSHIWV